MVLDIVDREMDDTIHVCMRMAGQVFVFGAREGGSMGMNTHSLFVVWFFDSVDERT